MANVDVVSAREARRSPIPFVCAADGAVLFWDEAGLTCRECGGSWERHGDIPVFVERSEIPEEAQQFLDEAEILGWERALGRRVPFAEFDAARADWRFLLPLSEKSRVLQVGADWGTLATALAPEVSLLIAVTDSLEEACFLEMRARQSGLDNVVPVVAPIDALPLPFAAFDAVILQRPLAPTSPRPGAQARELRLLRSLRSKLTPGGFLFFGAINRYGLADLTPSVRAILATLFSSLRDDRAGTGLRGYRRLVSAAGFARASFFAALPTFHHPRALFSLDSPSVCEFFLSRISSIEGVEGLRATALRLACRLGLSPRLIPQFGVVAWNRVASSTPNKRVARPKRD